ncbi:MAG: flagellar basal body-associated FliL family protein [Thermodesulfobacteriota bacterium]|nr:flagellar basal body-associated FliL family protein [Thermodesulfobacteriota bacterium]
MADDQPVNEGAEDKGVDGAEETKQPGGMKKWIIIGVAVLVLAVGGGGAWWFLVGKGGADSEKDTKKKASAGQTGETAGNKGQPSPFGSVFELDPFVVNLKSTEEDDGRRRYLKVEIEMEYSGEMLKAELDRRLPQLRDAVLMHLGTKTADELRDVQDKITLKNELLIKLNRLLINGKIKNIYFVDFIIQ